MGEILSPDDTPNNPPRTYEVEEPTCGWVSSNGHWGFMSMGLLYSREDPLCITLRFYDDEKPVADDWLISRRVMSTGYFEPSGDSDVRIKPHDKDNMFIRLAPPRKKPMQVYLPLNSVRAFLDRTYAEVPARDEDTIITGALGTWIAELNPTTDIEE